MKSQDILILFKLVSLDNQEKSLKYSETKLDANISGWEGWEIDRGLGVSESGAEYKNSVVISPDKYSARGLAAELGVSKTEVNSSIKRSISVGMAMHDRVSGQLKVNTKALLEFTVHAVKYVFPVKKEGIVRGIPTSFAAPILTNEVMTAGEYAYVWPDALGKIKGQSISPLYKSVPFAVKRDPLLYGYLALLDAIRLGSPREAKAAEVSLRKKLRGK